MLYGPAIRGRTEPLVVGRTSSRDQSGPDLLSTYPYPAYGAAVPVGSGPGGRQGAIGDLTLLSESGAGKGLNLSVEVALRGSGARCPAPPGRPDALSTRGLWGGGYITFHKSELMRPRRELCEYLRIQCDPSATEARTHASCEREGEYCANSVRIPREYLRTACE